ncbi:MAG: sigma factor-like helix-turn-helix DNA-binding protein, partial [Isosphaeraceae bacterium]
ARRAGSIRDPDLLGTWLYGVALRTARKTRRGIARRRRTEQQRALRQSTAAPGLRADRSTIECEQAEALHLEIDRLPGCFRAPVVLCYFEGLTLDEAAQRLRWPAGTLRSRLARARDKLRRGLTRRGFALSAAAITASLAPRSVSASISPLLCDSTTRAALLFATRPAASGALPASAAVLAQEVIRNMLLHKLKLAMLSILFLAVVAGSAGFLARPPATAEEPPRAPAATQAPVATKPDQAAPRTAPDRMTITGRVLDPDGKPVPNATTMAYASLKWPGRGDRLAPMWPSAIGQAQSNGAGRFRLDAPRVSSARHDVFGLIAIAPGYGAGWATLDPDAVEPATEITLRPEQVIHGRLFDVQGRPVRGVKVSVEAMRTIPGGSPDATLQQPDGPYFLPDQPEKLPGWPRPATTDPDGRFMIKGAGRGLRLGVLIDDPRFARLTVDIDTDASSDTKNVTMAVEPARLIAGQVTFADSGEPAPHARGEVETQRNGSSGWAGDFETDAQGRFRANPGAADHYTVTVFAPEGSPCLTVTKKLEWQKGTIEQTVDVALPRGVLVSGTVIEEGSGKPIAGARISYMSNPDRDQRSGASNGRVASGSDGSFQLGVMPGPGYLTVLGPGEAYVLDEIGQRMARASQPGGRRLYAHAFHKLELKPGSTSQEVAVALRPSASVPCQVVEPNGHPARDAVVISRVILQPTWVAWLRWSAYHRGAVRDGRFAVHGLSDRTDVPVYFLDAKHNLGATALLSSQSALGGPVTVRLQPCGAARVRLVDLAGNPVSGSRDNSGTYTAMMVVTPGPNIMSGDEADQDRLAADQDTVAHFDPVHYANGLVSNDKGELTLPSLIPGATYRIYDSTMGEKAGPRLRKEFTVKAGETLDLGDVLIERPTT